MKKIFSCFLVLLSFGAFAQNDFYEFSSNYHSKENAFPVKIDGKKHHYWKETVKNARNPDEVLYSSEMRFNEDGKQLSNAHYKKGKLVSSSQTEYKDNVKTTIVTDKKNKELFKTETVYSGKQILSSSHFRRNKLFMKNTYSYNESDKLKTSEFYYKRLDKPRIQWTYEYYPDGEKKESKLYRRGKLDHTWSFECNPEGKPVTKKDSSKICVKYESIAGEKIKVVERQGKDLKVLKTIERYNSADQLTETSDYDRNGLIINKTVYSFTPDNKMLSETYYKGKKQKLVYKNVYTYNDSQKEIIVMSFDKKEKPLKIYQYNYNDNN